jgi:hypothetical protein
VLPGGEQLRPGARIGSTGGKIQIAEKALQSCGIDEAGVHIDVLCVLLRIRAM